MIAFVDRLVADRWSGTMCDEDTFLKPDFGMIVEAINALDAETRTMLSLYAEEDGYLTVGGGSGQYVVYLSTADEQFWNLLSQKNDGGTILINIGGQIGDFPAKQVVDRNAVIQAARVFFESGNLASFLQWEKQM